MRRITQSLFLMALMLIGLSANAQAQTVLYERGDGTAWSDADLAEWPCDYATPTINNGLSVSTTNGGWACTKSLAATEDSKVTLTASLKTGGASGRSGSYDYVKIGGVSACFNEQDKKAFVKVDGTDIVLSLTYNRSSAYDISITLDQANGSVNYTIGGVSGTAVTSEKTVTNVVYGHSKAGRENYGVNPVLQKISVTEEKQTLDKANYTVKFVCNGEEIKAAETRDGAIGNAISLFTTDKEKIEAVDEEGTVTATYFYVSDDAEGKTIAEDGSTVVTIVFRLASNYSYTVNEVCNETVVSSKEGTALEGTTIKVPYHQYNLIDGVLYEKANTGNEYNYSFVLSQDAQVENLTYNATTINNVVYFSEAENIEGATANNASNANIRCSNSYGAYFENDVTITTLPAGTYKVAMQIWGNAGTTFTINAGETAVLEATTVGYRDAKISEPFTLTEETTITIPAAGSNGKVIDWIYIQRVPATYNYSVVTNLGTTIAEGSVSEGESVTFAYSEYILQNGTLYRTSLRNATGNGFYKYTLTPAQDGEELVIEYAPAIENVVYFSEAENIEGATANDRNNTDIRCSNALGAIFPEDVTIATLPAGAYKFGVQVWGNAGTTFEIKAGESTIMEAATVGYLNAYTKDIVLTEEAEIVIAAAGSNGKVIDWVYIQRVGDVPSYDINISSVGYATFYDSKYSFEVPAGVTAKTYTYESPVLNESVVYAEGDVIPAGEAVVLEGAAGTYTFNYAVATAEKDADNVLKGTDEATEITSENKLYILSNGAHGVGFYFQNEDGTSITNGAHKAYLEVEGDVETKSFYLFDEVSVTAIQGVVAAEAANGKVFDLQGRNVKNPVKGLYIVNGKKVVIK